jgi:hypothetical protein
VSGLTAPCSWIDPTGCSPWRCTRYFPALEAPVIKNLLKRIDAYTLTALNPPAHLRGWR